MRRGRASVFSATDFVPPRKVMPPFAALRAFDAIARLGSIRRAAQALDIDHGVVSRHLRALEVWTRTSLIERSQTGCILTEAGMNYHIEIAAAIDSIAAATLDLLHLQDQSRLRIWCMPGFAFQWLGPRISALEGALRNVAIEIRPTESVPDFGRHEADVDIQYLPVFGKRLSLPPIVQSVELAAPKVIPVASPEYLSKHPPIRTASDLLDHVLLHEESIDNWLAWLTGQGVDHDGQLSGMKLWHAHSTVDFARRGRGIALVNHFLAHEDLDAGQLVEIGGGAFEKISLGSYVLIARQDRWSNVHIARFRRWLTQEIATDIDVQADGPVLARQSVK